MSWFRTTGILEIRNSWLIAHIDPEIGRYYRWKYLKYSNIKLNTPLWEVHCTIIRKSAKPIFCWRDEIELEYEDRLMTNERHFWLPVKCNKFLETLYKINGLDIDYLDKFHITIGNNWNN